MEVLSIETGGLSKYEKEVLWGETWVRRSKMKLRNGEELILGRRRET